MIINSMVSGNAGGSAAPFFEIENDEIDYYINRNIPVVAAIYPPDGSCLFLPIPTNIDIRSQNAEIYFSDDYLACNIVLANTQIAFIVDSGPILMISPGYEVLPDGWTVRYFAYRET